MSPPTRSAALPELRSASVADIPAMLDVFFRAMEDLDQRRKRTVQPRNTGPLEQHFRHLLATDHGSSVVADDAGRVVAFGILNVRGRRGFLSFLFVVPEWQARGLGRAVLAECLRGAAGIEHLATCAEADQPTSTGLYASLGMAPRVPIYLLRGALTDVSLPDLPDDLRTRAIQPDAVAAMDTELLDYERRVDHAFWFEHERSGWMLETAGGELLGYGYAHRSGRLGPVAARDPGYLPTLLGHLVRSTPVLEGWQLVVPGPAITALRPLLEAGMRIDGTAAIYCADDAGPRFDRYLPMSFALL